jgi:hypothetical protein
LNEESCSGGLAVAQANIDTRLHRQGDEAGDGFLRLLRQEPVFWSTLSSRVLSYTLGPVDGHCRAFRSAD